MEFKNGRSKSTPKTFSKSVQNDQIGWLGTWSRSESLLSVRDKEFAKNWG